MQTLSFDDDLPSPTVPTHSRTAETIRAQVAGGILARGEPVQDFDVEKQVTHGST